MKYGLLHYRGDLTANVCEGKLLGHDELYRPYVITEAEYDSSIDVTTVWLETASGDALKAAS